MMTALLAPHQPLAGQPVLNSISIYWRASVVGVELTDRYIDIISNLHLRYIACTKWHLTVVCQCAYKQASEIIRTKDSEERDEVA